MWSVLPLVSVFISVAVGLEVCPGETRGERKCQNISSTHKVCAKIGDPDTSFWKFTGQERWCETVGHYGGKYGELPRCPKEAPTWCICKWATARWIKGEGCKDTVEFDCAATDVCNLKASYLDYDVDLAPAHGCMMQKCPKEWAACGDVTATSGV